MLLVFQVRWQLSHGEEESVTKVGRAHNTFCSSQAYTFDSLPIIAFHSQWWGAELLSQPNEEQKALWRIR